MDDDTIYISKAMVDEVKEVVMIPTMEEYRKELENDIGDPDDDWVLGYLEAMLNLLGKFNNGECEDCPFSRVEEIHYPDFVYPEYGMKCNLDKCRIDMVKMIIRNA